jgi:hypothetical protein
MLATLMAMLRFWLSSSQKCPEEQLLKSRDMNVAQLRSKFSLSLLEGQGLSTSGHTHYDQNFQILAKNKMCFDRDTFFSLFSRPSRFFFLGGIFLYSWISDMISAYGATYLVFVSSRSVKMRELSFAQFVYFLRKVCLFFKF